MNNNNASFIEYKSKNQLKDFFYFIKEYEYDDFLDICIKGVYIKCVKLDIKMWENSNEGLNLKYILIYKIY
jgi:hypothetical protein